MAHICCLHLPTTVNASDTNAQTPSVQFVKWISYKLVCTICRQEIEPVKFDGHFACTVNDTWHPARCVYLYDVRQRRAVYQRQ